MDKYLYKKKIMAKYEILSTYNTYCRQRSKWVLKTRCKRNSIHSENSTKRYTAFTDQHISDLVSK